MTAHESKHADTKVVLNWITEIRNSIGKPNTVEELAAEKTIEHLFARARREEHEAYLATLETPDADDSYCRATTESAVRKAKAVKARIDAVKEAERKRTAEAWIEEQTRAKGIDFRAMSDALTDILTRSEQSAKTFPNAPGHGDHLANASVAKRALKAVAASNPEAAP